MHRFTAPTIRRVRASTARGGRGSARAGILAVLLAALPCPFSEAQAQTAPGNTFNPTGRESWSDPEPRGMSLLRATRRRSPAGLLYPYPEEPPRFSTLGGGWLYRGSAEFGVLWDGGDEEETRFERYGEWTDEAFLSSLSLGFVHPETGRYLEFVSGGLGREDQFYRADLGQAGLWRIRGFYTRNQMA